MSNKPRVAVVSPFLDKRHGTERCVAEQLERLADKYEIHLYSGAVEDVDLSKIVHHRIPSLPGPHLARYLWFFAANHVRRWWDQHFAGLNFDLVFSPGINCADADIIAVHIVFAEFLRLAGPELTLRHNPLRVWPLLLHRRLSYRLFSALERNLYSRADLALVVISNKMEQDIFRCFGRRAGVSLVYHGVDLDRLNPSRCRTLRKTVREKLRIPETALAILLVGNDWKKKGLPCLIEAVGRMARQDLRILLRGTDHSSACHALIRQQGIESKTVILPQVPNIEEHYAAADVYVGPSIEDSFAIPPLEAMACGLPVIVSRKAGASEVITNGVDGFILEDPRDSRELAGLLDRICASAELRRNIGEHASATARQYTWQRNADAMEQIFDKYLSERRHRRFSERSAVAGT